MNEDRDAGGRSAGGKAHAQQGVAGAACPVRVRPGDTQISKVALHKGAQRIGMIGLYADRLGALADSGTGRSYLERVAAGVNGAAHHRIR